MTVILFALPVTTNNLVAAGLKESASGEVPAPVIPRPAQAFEKVA
jgi:hypothetical protein